MKGLDARLVIHQSERVSIDVEFAALQPGPLLDAGTCEPPFEAFVTPRAFRRVDRLLITVTRVVVTNEGSYHRSLVLLHKVPQRNVYRHSRGLDKRSGFCAVVRPMQNTFNIRSGI